MFWPKKSNNQEDERYFRIKMCSCVFLPCAVSQHASTFIFGHAQVLFPLL